MEWSKDRLSQLIRDSLGDQPLLVVSNREPYIHVYDGEEIRCMVPASGLTVALDPVMRACGGTWVAHGSGDADRKVVDKGDRVAVPPGEPLYTLRRMWLTREEEEGYYYGFANQALWPLCHIVYTRPTFEEEHWKTYQRVNRRFARAVLEEVGEEPAFVFMQDYHLTLLPRMLKEHNTRLVTAQFWHIPWPNPEAFRICPWGEEILDGLLANDLLGFHIRYHCDNFLDTVDRTVECRIDRERSAVHRKGRVTLVRPFPISVDFERLDQEARQEEVLQEMERLRSRYGLDDKVIGLGIDRLDYTKGIPERLRALERFFSKYIRFRNRVVFFQLGEPSRTHIPRYQELNAEVDRLIEGTNFKYTSGEWKPVIFLREHLSQVTLAAFRRLADFCIVSSLHDGMNLVAKEFVSSRVEEDGVLILSHFTGSARELTDALLINPYATDDFADAIHRAVVMPAEEQRRRMRRMRRVVRENNIYRWAGEIITELLKLEAKAE